MALQLALVVNGGTPSGQGVIEHNYWTRVGLIDVGVVATLGVITVATTMVILFSK